MKTSLSHLLRASALSSLCIASMAHAQENTPVPEDAEDEANGAIVVTGKVLYSDQVNALKSPTPIIDVPQSLTIITAEEIAARGFTAIRNIIDYTPGVNMSQGEGHRDAVVFRGVRSTADFFIDSMRDDVQYYRSLYNLEQVEILRGPNALLFGRGGTGGVLNRVTKKGVVGETFGAGQIALDTFGAFSVQGDLNLAAGENAAIRINAAYESLNNHRDFYDGDRIGFNPTLRVMASPDTTLDFSYEYADHQRFIDRGIPTGSDGRPVAAFKDIVFGDADLNTAELEAHILRTNLSHDFSESWKMNIGVFYGDYDKLYQNFYASGYDQAATPDVVTTDGYVDTTQRENLIISTSLAGEFETGSIGHTLVTGVEFISTSSDQDRFNPVWSQTNDDNEVFTIARPLNFRGGVGVNASGNATTVAFSAINDDTRVHIDVFSAYIQDEIEIAEWLDLVIGARFDSFDIRVNNVKDPANPELRTRKDEEFSPRGGLIIKPQENISIYASYSESFLPRSGEQFANINGDNEALDPDRFTNLEAGVKWDIRPDLNLTASVFDIEQSSPQPADNDPATLDVVDSNIQGFELQLQGRLADFWSVSAGYSFLDGEQRNRTGPTGLRPRELPDSMLSFWNDFQITGQLGIGLGATYQSKSFIDNGNTAVLPDYLRVDASAYYQISENLRVQVNIENLTDELYFPYAHSTHQASVGAPLNARFSIGARF